MRIGTTTLWILIASFDWNAACDASVAPAAQTSRPAAAVNVFDQSHAALTNILSACVQGDRVDYAALKEDRDSLDAYIAGLSALAPGDFEGFTRSEQYAFWINVYNAYTLQTIIDHYPLKSIMDIGEKEGGIWDEPLIPLGPLAGAETASISLNHVEHELLRPTFKDPRVHAAVNCASKGCPPLAKHAFTGAALETQLDAAVKAWLLDETRNRLAEGDGKLELSKIFEWFKADFEQDGASVTGWLARTLPDKAGWLASAKAPAIEYLDYSWELNDIDRK